MERHIKAVPPGLTHGARMFLQTHGVRLEPLALEEYRDQWLAAGIPGEQIDRAVAFEQTWGGLVLPPSARNDGGPKYLDADAPGHVPGVGWLFEVGTQRTAVPYSFEIGPDGAFGILGPQGWVRLHESIEGWFEALSLAHHAATHASGIRVLNGTEAAALDLDGFEEVPAVRGVADRWWRGADSLVAVYSGESEAFGDPGPTAALVYSGLDEWGLGTELWAVSTGWHIVGSAKPLVGWDINGVLIERRIQGVHESWFEHSDGRRLGFVTNGDRVLLMLMDDEDDPGEHAVDPAAEGWSDGFRLLNGQVDQYPTRDTVAFGVGVASLRRIIDTGTWPEHVRRESDRTVSPTASPSVTPTVSRPPAPAPATTDAPPEPPG